MSTLGDRYEFDVFFSYAWATDTGDAHLRNWCRAVADGIKTLLSQRFNGDGDDVRFHSYLDRDKAKSAQDIDKELEAATGRSAIFVAMVSNYYDSEYCKKEVNWFCQKLVDDGVEIADRISILRVQQLSDGKWPSRFKTSNNKPLMYLDFCNEHGQPLSMAKFMVSGSLGELDEPIEKAAVEIAEKIMAVKKTLQARETYLQAQRLPKDVLLFFEAESSDRERWKECGVRVEDVPSIVLPLQDPKPATDSTHDEYSDFHGLLMLRSHASDNFGHRIRRAYLHRRKLFLEQKQEVPWVLLDDLDDPPPESKAFKMPRVPLRGDWLPEMKKALWGE